MELKKIPTVHITDCFHPHEDLDDHWDLASQFALAYSGEIDLKGVLIDHPPRADYGDPALGSVGQLSVITGQTVPVGIGTKAAADVSEIVSQKPRNAGLNMIFKILEESDEPVAIHVVGSTRDIALATVMRPDLFREKCRGIYLNAGSACGSKLEYNVTLDPLSYSTLFRAPCPLYWMPCFHDTDSDDWRGTHGTFWTFCQKEILPYLSDGMKNYFLYATGRTPDHRWLKYIEQPVQEDLLQIFCDQNRNMWCTAGFLHAAGKTVTVDGEIVPIGSPSNPVFDFISVSVTCADSGKTQWSPADAGDRFIFKVLDPEKYPSAMTAALRTLLADLP